MSYLRKFSNATLARHYQMYHNNEALEELERRDGVIRAITNGSRWQFNSLVELATLYAFNYAKPNPNVDTNELINELHLRQDALDAVSEKTDKQLLFSFAEREETGNNLSVEAAYEAGYVAGVKASRKDLVRLLDLHEAAKEAGEELTYRYGRPVITIAMREHLPCPFEHSETDL